MLMVDTFARGNLRPASGSTAFPLGLFAARGQDFFILNKLKDIPLRKYGKPQDSRRGRVLRTSEFITGEILYVAAAG